MVYRLRDAAERRVRRKERDKEKARKGKSRRSRHSYSRITIIGIGPSTRRASDGCMTDLCVAIPIDVYERPLAMAG